MSQGLSKQGLSTPSGDHRRIVNLSSFQVLLLTVFCLGVVSTMAMADSMPVASTGPGNGTVVSGGQSAGCGIELFTADGTYENGYAWQYSGQAAPDYGSFAECYDGVGLVCRAIFDFSQVGNQLNNSMDVYVWDDAGGAPGTVIDVVTDVLPGPVAFWPSLSRHEVPVNAAINGDFWVGYWANWPDQLAGWFVGADTDGLTLGCPFTNYAPSIGFPTGWGNVSAAWGPTQALGIGAAVLPGGAGACCYPDGTCLFQDFVDCEGEILGEDIPCDPNPCDQPTACCYEDGSCQVLLPTDCNNSGGTFLPDTSCAPNPCDQPRACCFEDGSCIVLLTAACAGQGGNALPDESSCSPNPCPQPPKGACCFADGSCLFVEEPDCENLEGAYLGDDIACQPNPCDQPPTGACCFVGGGCIVLDVFECGEIGEFQGADTTCEPNPCAAALGACCYASGSCTVRTAEICEPDGMFMGPDTVCEPNPCPGLEPGACCVLFACSVVTEFECLDIGGNFLGDPASCDPNPCGNPSSGACCFADGSCSLVSETDCIVADGSFQGDDTGCDPNPCPTPVNGACCLAQGVCEVSNDLVCAASDGSFQGADSSCDPNPCPQPCTPFALAGRPSSDLPHPPYNPFLDTSGRGAHARVGDGANRGGVLVLHTNDVVSSSDACGDAGVFGCGDIVSRTDQEQVIDIHVVALFASDAQPRLSGVTFGLDFPICVGLSDWGACSDFELPTSGWPESGSGTAVTWSEPQTDRAVEVYWLAGYGSNTERGQLSLTEHPSQGAYFADDGIPARLDPIVELGSLGFFQDGLAPCPVAQEPLGACCIENLCVQLTYDSCVEEDGIFAGVDVPCDPNPCTTVTGACCLPERECIETAPNACEVLNGSYVGDGTICTPTICGPTVDVGACCFIDQSCLVLSEDDCLAAEGIFKGANLGCDPDPCFLAGACCFPTGACVDMFWFDCFDADGEFLGDGVPCDADVCPTPGACCFEDGSCEELYEEVCDDQGGSFQGDGVACTVADCPQPPPGACCFEDGTCTFVDQFECAFQLGDFLGEDLACEPNPCPQPEPGACCFQDGTCQFVDRFVCGDLLGDFLGEGGTCDPNPCPQPDFGACCLSDGSCVETFEFDCDSQGGLFGGDGVLCEDVTCNRPCDPPMANRKSGPNVIDGTIFGADAADQRLLGPNAGGTLVLHVDPDISATNAGNFCDAPIVPDCESVQSRVDTSEPVSFWALAAFPAASNPRLAGVAFGISYPTCFFILEGGPCGDFELPSAGWPDAGTGNAVTWSTARTETFIPVYWFNGYEDSLEPIRVNLIPHPDQGAVFADDSIPSELDPIAALGSLGFRLDGNTPCSSSDAPGACCYADGSCEVVFESDCSLGGGDFQGAGTSCDPNPCSAPGIGACCFDDGSCALRTVAECDNAGGAYQGDGVPCDPNPCGGPSGACCLSDGSCLVTTGSGCSGDYQGDGTTCDPNPCPQPTGACCFPDGGCSVETGSDCSAGGGQFQGDGTVCDPNPCPQPIGACCLPNDTCVETSPETCDTAGGDYLGNGVTCDPNPCLPGPEGACCFDFPECEVLTEAFCINLGGEYQGEGTDCFPNPCTQPKVCCVDAQCFAIGFDCDQLGGVWVYGSDSCDPNPCPVTGACCFPDETCQVLLEFECESAGGGFVGLGVPCDPIPCDVVPTIESTWGKIKERFRSWKQ